MLALNMPKSCIKKFIQAQMHKRGHALFLKKELLNGKESRFVHLTITNTRGNMKNKTIISALATLAC